MINFLFSLEDECLLRVKNYTEAEVKDTALNTLLNNHCATVIPKVSILINNLNFYKTHENLIR